MRRRALLALAAWVIAVTALHLRLNVSWTEVFNDLLPVAKRKLNVAYIPVTCHLACPVTDYITRSIGFVSAQRRSAGGWL